MIGDQGFLPREKENRPIYVMGIDVGAYRTRCVILSGGANYPMFVGLSSVRSSGWLKGDISNRADVIRNVETCVKSAMPVPNVSIKTVVMGIGHRLVRSSGNANRYGDKEFVLWHTERDPYLWLGIPEDLMGDATRSDPWISVPGFVFDDHFAIARHILAANRRFAFEPLAVMRALPGGGIGDARVLIDIGHQASSCLIFRNSAVTNGFGMALSISAIARNISYEMGVGWEQALAIIHGPSRYDAWVYENRQYTKVLEKHSKRMALAIAKEMIARGIDLDWLPSSILMIGDGAKLYGLDHAIEEILGRPVQFAVPRKIEEFPSMDLRDSVGWCTACSLAIEAFSGQSEGGSIPRLRPNAEPPSLQPTPRVVH